MSYLIAGLTGMPGSGKSLACSYLEEMGFKKISFGEITLNELKRRNLPVTEENEKKIRHEIREERGQAAYAKLWLESFQGPLTDNLVIDGVYSWEEVKILRNYFREQFVLIAILASPAIRHLRLGTREQRPLTPEEAFSRDLDEIENLNKGGTIAMADINIVNESCTPRILQKNMRKALKKWQKDHPGMNIF
jgi:dephospho-CoA kinase